MQTASKALVWVSIFFQKEHKMEYFTWDCPALRLVANEGCSSPTLHVQSAISAGVHEACYSAKSSVISQCCLPRPLHSFCSYETRLTFFSWAVSPYYFFGAFVPLEISLSLPLILWTKIPSLFVFSSNLHEQLVLFVSARILYKSVVQNGNRRVLCPREVLTWGLQRIAHQQSLCCIDPHLDCDFLCHSFKKNILFTYLFGSTGS